ncbi:MAG: hypothetical protein JST91_04050 [Actinobacteria bacterium]|nr:hypothetical protein [Actinomycetota bacterium]
MGERTDNRGQGEKPRANTVSTSVRESFRRPLRIFPFDPLSDRFLDPIVCRVPYERVCPGPAGRLVDVVDFDIGARQWHPPLDLDAPAVLIGQGLTPSETDLRSHQQMVYAVAMRVLETFERGLGRPFDWPDRLRILPHAFGGWENAAFDPGKFAVMFGYFAADRPDAASGVLRGQHIFTCLSYDVIAHLVCNAVMARLRPAGAQPDDDRPVDNHAFDHGFADLIAILVRFFEPDVVARTIRANGASLAGTALFKIATQFGVASGDGAALRSFPEAPDPADYRDGGDPIRRAGILTSAFLEAFLAAHDRRTADLLRMNGGAPQPGYVHPDLVARLAAEASFLAARVARSAIAALDYLPPLNITFYDFLRAFLATDTMLVGKSQSEYRSRLVEAFHTRGLIPRDPGSLAIEALILNHSNPLRNEVMEHAGDGLLYTVTAGEYRRQFMVQPSRVDQVRAALDVQREQNAGVWRTSVEEFAGARLAKLRLDSGRPVEVVGFQSSNQIDSVGNLVARTFVNLAQRDGGKRPLGVTLVCDSVGAIQYLIGGKPAPRPRRRATPTSADRERLAEELTSQPRVCPPVAGGAAGLRTPTDRDGDIRARRRPLRVIPFDPMVDRAGRSVIADVIYEQTGPGPAGRLVEVIDYDPVHQCWYEPIDLDDAAVLLDSGIDVAESDPRFHQQMVYAVVMRVLETFERALGRPFRWRGKRRLRVYPHAFVGENAYFDEDLFALLFGYFSATQFDPGPNLPGQVVFTALSHDIIAHETTHAVLHRLRKHYSNPTNPDVLAFHEGFSDIVAILQHFTYREVVAEHLAATRGDLNDRAITESSPLLSLASQFGYAVGDQGPLRTALMKPDKNAYANAREEHARGAVLVAAVMDGFLRSYHEGIEDLVRIATAGTGVLQPGALHPDLVDRVAAVACFTADRITQICIRAFDYLPPVDVTFSDYLRALVTADIDLFPDDSIHLRANLIEGFRARGIYPSGVASLAERSLRIEPVDPNEFTRLPFVRDRLLDAAREFDRRRRSNSALLTDEDDDDESQHPTVGKQAAEWARREDQTLWAKKLHTWATEHHGALGLAAPAPHWQIAVDGFFTSQRVDADGYLQSQITVQFVQRDKRRFEDLGGLVPMGGVTVVADGEGYVRYAIGKPLPSADPARMKDLADFAASVEHRLTSIAWSPDRNRRIVDRLNLRSLDGRR